MAKLSELSGVTIQTLVSSGREGNLKSQNITEWIKRLKRVKPLSIQLYTLDRPHPASDLKPATQEELNQLKAREQKGVASQHLTYPFIVVSLISLRRSYKNLFIFRKREIICQMLRRDPI